MLDGRRSIIDIVIMFLCDNLSSIWLFPLFCSSGFACAVFYFFSIGTIMRHVSYAFRQEALKLIIIFIKPILEFSGRVPKVSS